jgi:MFS family permease
MGEMNIENSATPTAANRPWYRELTRYHWFVLIVASAAWFFDCLDQRLFSLARVPALEQLIKTELLEPGEKPTDVQAYAKVVTACFLVGWGIGGLIFGALGDKFGRAKMLTLTILIYSAFTGLSYFSQTKLDFTIFRFLTGVGVGGVFGLAVSLIAETVPSSARAQCLGLLQVLSTVGNITAGFVKMGIDALQSNGTIAEGRGWRWMFLIGALPAFMIIFTRGYLKEPASWLRLKEQGLLPKGSLFAPYAALLSQARWRKNLIIGALLASTGVVGLWAIGEYAVDLQNKVFTQHFEREKRAANNVIGALDDKLKAEVGTEVKWAIAVAYLWNMFGAAVGMWIFTRIAQIGRRPAFFIGFTAAMVATFLVYWNMRSPSQAYWMMFLMGAAQLSVFAGFAIYLPELFPNSLRSTGTSFCYNLGRFAAAIGSFFSASLTSFYSARLTQDVLGKNEVPDASLPSRYAAMTMCAIFLVGIITVFFAPETKGKPLPE